MPEPTVELPAEAQQYVEALIRDADQLIEEIENLIGRRDQLWGAICVLNGWDDDDINGDNFEASNARFEALKEQSRLGDVDLLLDLAAGRIAGHQRPRSRPVEPVSSKRAYRRRRAIRGPLAD